MVWHWHQPCDHRHKTVWNWDDKDEKTVENMWFWISNSYLGRHWMSVVRWIKIYSWLMVGYPGLWIDRLRRLLLEYRYIIISNFRPTGRRGSMCLSKVLYLAPRRSYWEATSPQFVPSICIYVLQYLCGTLVLTWDVNPFKVIPM